MEALRALLGHEISVELNGKVYEFDLRKSVWPFSVFSLFYLIFCRRTGFKDMKVVEKRSRLTDNTDDKGYIPRDTKLPVLPGWLTQIYIKALRTAFGRKVLMDMNKAELKAGFFNEVSLPEFPTFVPIVHPDLKTIPTEDIDLWNLVQDSSEEEEFFHFNTISHYINAYRNGTTTPTIVAQNILKAIKLSESQTPNMRIMVEYHEKEILEMAMESTLRWASQQPLSVFDGIPVSVKDEVFLGGYPCRGGLSLEDEVVKSIDEDGYMVHKLRKGGALLIGVCNMHQMGVGVTGINNSPHGTARNPYNVSFPCGGSSSGPAASVASGLCPVSLCADGGGSIRIPAATTGTSGLKCSFGRISNTGLRPACFSVSHAGFICSTVRDTAIAYGYLSGADENYEVGMVQPPPTLSGFNETDLSALKVGVDWAYFNHCNPVIKETCAKAVDFLRNSCHAEIVEISISEMQEAIQAHMVITLAEMANYGDEIYNAHYNQINTDTEMNLQVGKTFTAHEYFEAQKQRTRNMNVLEKLFQKVDCIATPCTGDFQPQLTDDILHYGYADVNHLLAMTRYAVLGNLTGNPSISVPVGYSSETNLPIGLLVQTTWWREDLLLRFAHALESYCPLKKPQVYYDVLHNELPDAVSILSDDGSDAALKN